jgi:DNA-binding NarL/FixJ family response regulator
MGKDKEKALNILIADDHAIVRKGLKQILAEIPEQVFIVEAKDGNEVLEKIAKKSFDIVLLDISMPGRSGLDVLKQMKKEQPAIKVLMLSIYPEEQYAVRTLKAGASGYITKESSPDELLDAVREIIQGKRYVTASLAEKLVQNLNYNENLPAHEKLSDREYEVLCMIASGKTLSDISAELSLSIKTVSTYRARILEKLKLKNNMHLTRYVLEHGIQCT